MSKKSNDRFGIVKYKVLSDPSLSIQSKGLYSLIACYVDKNREAYPSASTLADSMDISQRYVFKLLKELRQHNYIKRIKGKLVII
jgi:DNA-binding IscR family transcriptional regulator|tara:strand:+ start:2318 stop:2572 length:255 start_codon:yes stop_codon:yes gene_type:complete